MRAEAAGDPGPRRQQAILGRGRWDANALWDIVRDYVVKTLADGNAVLVIDETGFLKQGKASCGVARQGLEPESPHSPTFRPIVSREAVFSNFAPPLSYRRLKLPQALAPRKLWSFRRLWISVWSAEERPNFLFIGSLA